MLSEYAQKLKNLDFMTPPIQLNIGGKDGVKTFFGVMMTALYIGSIVVLSYLIGQTYFDKSSPTVVQESSQTDYNPVINIAQQGLFPVVYVFQQRVVPVLPAQVSNFLTLFYTKYRLIETINPDGSVNVTYNVIPMNFIACSQAVKDPVLGPVYQKYLSTQNFATLGMAFGLCPQFQLNESYIQGGGSQSTGDLLTVDVFPCMSTPTSNCTTLGVIRNMSVVVTMPTSSVILANYTNPVSSFLNIENFYYINEYMNQKYQMKAMMNEIWDVDQITQAKTLRSNFTSIDKTIFNAIARDFTQISCTPVEFAVGTCVPFMEFEFMSGPKIASSIRSYKTMTQILSQIGGINSIALMVFVYINLAYNYYAKKSYLVDRVFKFFQGVKALKAQNDKSLITPLKSENGNDQSPTSKRSIRNPLEDLNNAELEELREEAYNVIQKNLDVITIVRELNNLKFLTHLFLKDYQQRLSPLVSLRIQTKIDRARKQRPKTLQDRGLSPGPKTTSAFMEKENFLMPAEELIGAKTFDKALRILTEKAVSIQPDTELENLTIEERVNSFCMQALDKNPLLDISQMDPSLGSPKSPMKRNLPFNGNGVNNQASGFKTQQNQQVFQEDEFIVEETSKLKTTKPSKPKPQILHPALVHNPTISKQPINPSMITEQSPDPMIMSPGIKPIKIAYSSSISKMQ